MSAVSQLVQRRNSSSESRIQPSHSPKIPDWVLGPSMGTPHSLVVGLGGAVLRSAVPLLGAPPLPAPGIATDCLDMGALVRCNADVAPGRRDGELIDARFHRFIADRLAGPVTTSEALATALALQLVAPTSRYTCDRNAGRMSSGHGSSAAKRPDALPGFFGDSSSSNPRPI